MEITLAIECSSLQGSVALVNREGILSLLTWKRQRSHGELITNSIEQALSMAQLNLKKVDFLSVSNGPGSFTGIRVGLSAAKGLAYANALPVMVYDSLRVLAEFAPKSSESVVCLQNAYSQFLFFSKYTREQARLKEVVPPKLIKIKDLDMLVTEPSLVLGEGYKVAKEEISTKVRGLLIVEPSLPVFPLASHLGQLALTDYRPERTLDWKSVQALYIRASAAEEKLKKGLLKPVT